MIKYTLLGVAVMVAGCVARPPTVHKTVPAMKPVCPHGVNEPWCRPLAASEKGITNLGNRPDEE